MASDDFRLPRRLEEVRDVMGATALRHELERGQLIAFYFDHFGRQHDFNAAFWITGTGDSIMGFQNGRFYVPDPSRIPRSYEVFVVAAPASAAEQAGRPTNAEPTTVAQPGPEQPAPLDPFRTGVPGRPTAIDYIEAEARRRIDEGEVTPVKGGLTRFGRVLVEWWGAKRMDFNPPGPKVGSKAIADKIRGYWKSRLGAVENVV
jgi:hypothetical protein